jgi:adenylate cyclase
MFHVSIRNDKQSTQLSHATGPLEFGRGPQRESQRVVIEDAAFSRDQLRVQELSDRRVQVKNLSERKPVLLAGGASLEPGAEEDYDLPLRMSAGRTQIVISAATQASAKDTANDMPPPAPAPEPLSDALNQVSDLSVPTFRAIPQPIRGRYGARPLLSESGEAPSAEALARWFERVIHLQQAPAGSPEFYQQTAQAVVDLIGLDLGLVLLSRNNSWVIAGTFAANDTVSVQFSRTLLNHVVTQRRTFYQDLESLQLQAVSLANIESVVAAPIYGLEDDVVGVLYGMREAKIGAWGGIRPLEAQLVQLMASAVGANLARTVATRNRVQFEQFFSPELAQQLEKDPSLLEGRDQEITVLFSDLRGFTRLSQRIGAADTCRLVRDMMEQLSERIVEQGGTIVDYAGDGILAMWNAPVLQEDHAARACRAALAMLAELPGLNARWKELADDRLAIGIGVSTGMAQVGNTGSSRKFKYGPRGHTVNLASRVQDATKNLRLPLLITASTHGLLPPDYASRRLGRVRLAGVKEPTLLYELHGTSASPEWQHRRQLYEAGLAFYEERLWAKACQTLLPLLELTQDSTGFDTPTLKLLRRSWDCLEAPPEPFDPIIEITNK